MTVAAALELLIQLLVQAKVVSDMIQAQQAAGQTTLTPEQWATILKADNDARAALIAALTTAK